MFSKRARYALHGVGFLAYHHPSAPLPFGEILAYLEDYSSEATLSPGYIAKVFQDLSRAGIVRTSAGRKGGYTLACEPDELQLYDLVAALDGAPQDGCCLLATRSCEHDGACGVGEVVDGAQRAFYAYLRSESAGSLARRMFRVRGPRGAPSWSQRRGA